MGREGEGGEVIPFLNGSISPSDDWRQKEHSEKEKHTAE